MYRTHLDLSDLAGRGPIINELWVGIERVALRVMSPLRIPEQTFDALRIDGELDDASDSFPDLAHDDHEFFAALVAAFGAKGRLNATQAAHFVADVATIVPVDRAHAAAMMRVAGWPDVSAERGELNVYGAEGAHAGRLAKSVGLPSGHQAWLYRDDAGRCVRLLIAPPPSLAACLMPPRRGEVSPSFGLAA